MGVPLDDHSSSLLITTAMNILAHVLHQNAPKHTRMWGLVALATGTAIGEPIVSLYLDIMATLADDDRKFLLDLVDSSETGARTLAGPGSRVPKKKSKSAFRRVELPSSTGLPFVMQPVLSRWDPVAVAKGLLASVKARGDGRMLLSEIQLLTSCLKTIEQAAGVGTQGQAIDGIWLDLFYPGNDTTLFSLDVHIFRPHIFRLHILWYTLSPTH